jgi:hypothetical protein
MKKLILLFSIFTLFASAQIFNPVKWDFSYTQISDTEVDLHFKAVIDDGWYVIPSSLEMGLSQLNLLLKIQIYLILLEMLLRESQLSSLMQILMLYLLILKRRLSLHREL